jgi:hypothetical protein
VPRTINTLGDAWRTGQDFMAVCGNIECRCKRTLDLQELIKHVGELHPLVPVRGHVHYSERLRCPACKHRGAFVWMGPPKEPTPIFGEVRAYQVNNWGRNDNGRLVSRIGLVGHVDVAHATFQAAVKAYSLHRITLQQGAFVLEDSGLRLIKGGKR